CRTNADSGSSAIIVWLLRSVSGLTSQTGTTDWTEKQERRQTAGGLTGARRPTRTRPSSRNDTGTTLVTRLLASLQVSWEAGRSRSVVRRFRGVRSGRSW